MREKIGSNDDYTLFIKDPLLSVKVQRIVGIVQTRKKLLITG